MREWLSNELIIGMIAVVIIVIVQIIVYLKSYSKCFEENLLHDSETRRKAVRRYWEVCVAVDIINAIVFCFQKIWLPTLENDKDIITGITIITTVLISFFGLTAASYTFQINDMHGQQREYPNYEIFIAEYLEITRFKFTIALWATVLISALSIGIFLINGILKEYGVTEYYVQEAGFILCCLAVEVILWMMYLNWVLFFHERYIDKYAFRVLRTVKKKTKGGNKSFAIESVLKRINDLELIFQRLLKNSIHIRGAYPLENRDLLAMFSNVNAGNTAQKQRAEECVADYYKILTWRNAVVRNANSKRNEKREGKKVDEDFLKRLENVEAYIRENRLNGESFSGMNLSGAELFAGGNLERANFSDSNLQNVDLTGSDCMRADFSNALINRVHFVKEGGQAMPGVRISEGTEMAKTNFYSSNMESSRIEYGEHAEYSKVDTESGAFVYYSMEEGNFDNAVLSNSSFRNVDFIYSSFEGAQMYYTNLDHCRASLAVFRMAMLSNSLLQYSDFTKANFTSAIMVSTMLLYCNFEEARMHRANLANSSIINGIWNKVLATGATLKGSGIYPTAQYPEDNDSRGEVVDFTQMVLKDVDFTECKIHYTDMSESQINGCIFTLSTGQNNYFTNVDMRDCLFNGTIWKISIFDYAQFDGSTFKNTEFSDGRFIKTQFNQCLFISFAGDTGAYHEERKRWEESRGYVSEGWRKEESGNQKAMFEGAYLEQVSFAGARGMTEEMFKDATVIGVDFRGTGISKGKLNSIALGMKDCVFDPVWMMSKGKKVRNR